MTSTEQQQDINEQSTSPADITQQVTTPTPATKPKTEKNPKRVAAGKATAERTRLARGALKKALAEANIIIEKNKADKAANDKSSSSGSTAAKLPPITEEREDPEPHNTTPQRRASFSLWVVVAGVAVAGVGVAVTVVTYLFKREKVKAFLGLTTTRQQAPQ